MKEKSKKIEFLRKLKALAYRGVGGEKLNAKALLEKHDFQKKNRI